MRRVDRNTIIVDCDEIGASYRTAEVCLIINQIVAIEAINHSSCWVYMTGSNVFKAHMSMEALMEFIR